MKKYLALALALIMALSISVPVFAKESPELDVKDVLISATDKDGKDIMDEVELEINDESRAAEKELSNDKIKEILGGEYDDKLVLGDIYDVIYSGSNYPVELVIKKPVSTDDKVFVLTKVNGVWVVVKDVVISDGQIKFSISEDSVLAFVYEREIPEEGPVTGNNVIFALTIAMVCLAGTVYCAKRTAA
jgi:hypothetical protein